MKLRFGTTSRTIALKGAGLLAILTLFLGACRITKNRFPGFAGAPPKTLAVLAPEGTFPERGRQILRQLVGGHLEERQYEVLDDEFVDLQLTRAGFDPGAEKWLPGDAELAKAGSALGADVLVILSRFEDEQVSAAVLYQRGLGGVVRWLDTRTARTVWSTEVSITKFGGLAIESGQVVKALENNFENGSEAAFVRLASAIARDVAAEVPLHPEPAGVKPRPVLDSLTVVPAASLAAGREWTAEARGSRGGRAIVRFATLTGEFPLVEEEPGVYRGRFRVVPGWGEVSGSFRAVLYDAYGESSAVVSTRDAFALAAPRLDPPAKLDVKVADAARRRILVSWEPSPQVQQYQIVRTGGTGPVSFVVDASGRFEDQLTDGETRVAYVVAARSAAGAIGPPSEPRQVEIQP
jgi:hypothetical protein